MEFKESLNLPPSTASTIDSTGVQPDNTSGKVSDTPPTGKYIKCARKELTLRNRAFLEHLVAGLKTMDAYRLAGYKGGVSAAYELRSTLREELQKMIDGAGIDRNGLLLELNKLNELPLEEDKKTVSLNQKLRIVDYMRKLLPKEKPSTGDGPTPFVAIQVNDAKQVNVNESKNQ